ncbi:MAG TPA: carboxymuconolactone decarboxylase family protein [Solirubrobacteraceae bacterium]|nr:carboxymuconolactone decarboxylase family protein [Solirubrobacteraceae bacterium]
MSRIEGVPANKANPLVRIIYRMVRRELGRMTGKRELTPDIPVRAHRTSLLVGYGIFESTVARKPRVDAHLRGLVQLKSAVMQGCEMCQDIGSQQALAWGVGQEQVNDLYRYRESPHFEETERLVLDLAVGMTLTPVQVSDELFAELRSRFDDAELVELVNLIAVENLRSRFNAAFQLPSVGFNEGAACARMEGPRMVVGDEPADLGIPVATA